MSPHARPAVEGVDIMAFFDCTAEDRDKILNMSDEEAQKAHFLSDELKEMVVFARAQTRFLEACKSGDVVTVRSMIAEGVVDVLHPREDTGACPLSEAAHGGSVAVMIELQTISSARLCDSSLRTSTASTAQPSSAPSSTAS